VVGGVVSVATGVKTIRSRFWPSPTNRSVRVLVPAGSVSTVDAVVQALYEPVVGTATVAAGLPLTRTSIAWAVVPHDATRNAAVYFPALATGTAYLSHSPSRTYPTAYPPLIASTSTPSFRYAPPRLPAVVSWYATPSPPAM
jgi:hypothetical protein